MWDNPQDEEGAPRRASRNSASCKPSAWVPVVSSNSPQHPLCSPLPWVAPTMSPVLAVFVCTGFAHLARCTEQLIPRPGCSSAYRSHVLPAASSGCSLAGSLGELQSQRLPLISPFSKVHADNPPQMHRHACAPSLEFTESGKTGTTGRGRGLAGGRSAGGW